MDSAHAVIAALVAAYAASAGGREAGRDRRDVHDAPGPLDELGEQREREAHRREVVDAHDASTIVGGELVHAAALRDAGVVHEHVDAAELVGRPAPRTRRARRGRRGRSSTLATRARARGTRASTSSSWSARRAQMPTVAPRARTPPRARRRSRPTRPSRARACPSSRTLMSRRRVAAASLDRPCRSRPTPSLLTDRRRRRHRRGRRASARRSRSRSPRFGADVAICDRDADGLARTAAEIEAAGRRAHAELLDVRDGDAVRRVGRDRSTAVDVLVNNAGGGFRRRVPRRERQGPGRARPRELHERHALHPRPRAAHAGDGRLDRQHHVDRGAPRRARLRGLQRDEGRAREPLKSLALELGDRRIRVNCIAPDVIPTPGIGGDMPVKTPLPFAGHVDDVAGRGRLPRVRLVAVRHRHDDPRRRRQPRGRRLGPRARRQLGHRGRASADA